MSKLYYISAGHSNTDSGAVSGSFVEYTLNCKVARACAAYLGNYDCTVNLDFDSSIQSNCDSAKRLGASAFLEIHHNAGGGDGAEVYYAKGDMRAQYLASLLAGEFKAIGQNLRSQSGQPLGVKPSAVGTPYNFGVCRINSANGIPAILGEFAFVDNVKDREIIDSEMELVNEGKAYARALVLFDNIPLKTVIKPAEPVNPVKPTQNSIAIKLYNERAYSSAFSLFPFGRKNGTYYFWDDNAINGRRRVTNTPENIGKSGKVSFWIKRG